MPSHSRSVHLPILRATHLLGQDVAAGNKRLECFSPKEVTLTYTTAAVFTLGQLGEDRAGWQRQRHICTSPRTVTRALPQTYEMLPNSTAAGY